MPQKKHPNALKGLVFGKHTVAGLILSEFELKKKKPRQQKINNCNICLLEQLFL